MPLSIAAYFGPSPQPKVIGDCQMTATLRNFPAARVCVRIDSEG